MHLLAGLHEFLITRIAAAYASGLKLLFQLHRLRQVAVMKKRTEAVEHVIGETEDLSDFAHCNLRLVSDDICGHCRPGPAIAPVNFLNYFLASVTARKIQINIWPVRTAFTQKSLEEQLCANWIDGGDPERI